MRISDWSSDGCSSDTGDPGAEGAVAIIAIERRKAGDERLLRQIHRLVGIANLLDDEPVAACFVTTQQFAICVVAVRAREGRQILRSEEHTSELQSLMRTPYAVLCL